MSANAMQTPGSPVSVVSFAWSDFTNWVPKASENNTTVHPASATPTPGSPASGASFASSDFTDVVPKASENNTTVHPANPTPTPGSPFSGASLASSDFTDVASRASEDSTSVEAYIAMYAKMHNIPMPKERKPCPGFTITLSRPPAVTGGETPSSSGETDSTSPASSDDGRAPTVSERMTWVSEWSDAGAPIRNRRRRPPPRGPLVRKPVQADRDRQQAVPDTMRLLSDIGTLQEQFEAERDINSGHRNNLQSTVNTLVGTVTTLAGSVNALHSTVTTLHGTVDTLHSTVDTLQGTLDALVATHEVCYAFNRERNTCPRTCKRLHICNICRGRHPETKCEQPGASR
ncbi:uncharacterized protein PFL1_02163 [Pseudozyma flocculosa PF-1]|uniref:uncharacterized protein n=1 Tax=Pseudozyma flocculosa PF-1 TaxID=1277687 RepID=UPI000456019A|nr:uncharacterized protein PFL1_02163 [Pseudozyma flocculosa PF-1]EPQ30046.1 hypothetical protein PFL1_02163 [Pseudozyma flocculosa PF-1]